ncbi:tRNA (guanosine(46)-N7)-methyltransferase TrmB [Ahniella affigens]|uniref:tRNA (guanine-N(7)-)-methyltransferase n=1 Tax=Ahniella affigens TaxID=2021234 RepID=A0A2P1PV66_9GAMM|nr:tRNA (guanosine(46)-N7)-methyltransferase TrmB [Ahniella affigens]AVP98674.1 tRNA (guanosine(46)-N7)-methyltransferase TrmB [Ahniella affigens]
MCPEDDNDHEASSPFRREIKSFVLRQGRTTEAQKRAFDLNWPRFGIEYHGQPRDLQALFPAQQPLILEIGFGNGQALIASAAADPARNHIGAEVHRPGVGRALNAAADLNLQNLRVYAHDAVEVLRHEIADGALNEVRLWFPDPWHKKRHNKRRIVQPPFVALIASKLAPGGLFHLATDWMPYAEHMLDVLEASPEFVNERGPRGIAERPSWRIETHFERRGLKLGHEVADLLYRRK